MFEDMTYDYLLRDTLANAPPGIDTRQGSIFYDAVAGALLKIAKLYTDLDLINRLTTIASATGDYLDARACEFGLYRRDATSAMYKAVFDGATPEDGERFYYDGAYFRLRTVQDADGPLRVFEAEVPGDTGNVIYPGTPAVPVNAISGLISATFGDIYANGTDVEDDESLRKRVQEKIAGPAENGNKQHYKTWCESVDGVGQARIFPLWNGENTVKAVLIDPEGRPCSEEVVRQVQEYIDPADKGMTVEVNGKVYVKGDGLGNGKANIGAHFTAVAATSLEVTVSFTAELAPGGTTTEDIKERAKEAIGRYFQSLVLDSFNGQNIVVRISMIGAMLSQVEGLVDYHNLQLNGGTENITPTAEEVPVLLEVTVS